LANSKFKLNEYYHRVFDNIENATPEIASLTLDTLDIKVQAKGNDNIEIKGVIPLNIAVPTTEQ
jgi:hypothetical protein